MCASSTGAAVQPHLTCTPRLPSVLGGRGAEGPAQLLGGHFMRKECMCVLGENYICDRTKQKTPEHLVLFVLALSLELYMD